jgi:hypothetical protein
MSNVSNQLKKAIGKEMTASMSSNYTAHGDSNSVSNFLTSAAKLKKEVQEDGKKGHSPQIGKTDGLSSETLTKILTKIAKDLDNEVEITKGEHTEAMGASSAGAYVGPLFGKIEKRKIKKSKIKEEKLNKNLSSNMSIEDLATHHNVKVDKVIDALENGVNFEFKNTTEMMVAFEMAMENIYEDLNYYDKLEKIESKEATTSSSAGAYDVPFGAPKRDPLQIDTPKNVYSKLRSVTDKNFPKLGGPGSKYVKIKDKCKKFPYCNQGDINALEFFENNIVKEAIKRVSKKYDLDSSFIKGVIMEKLNK